MIPQIYVSLDLETTGLEPTTDRIIEVGAVKFQGAEVIGTFHTLVNPYCPLPPSIRKLTNIIPKELDSAPPFSAVASDLHSFLAEHPIIGQSISFDMNFLTSHKLGLPNHTFDIMELSLIILPELPDYSLATVAEFLEIPYEIRHRALEDASVTMKVFLALVEKACQLDPRIISQIVHLTTASASVAKNDWCWRPLFREIEESQRKRRHSATREVKQKETKVEVPSPPPPCASISNPIPLNISYLTSLLQDGGDMARSFPDFEHRPGQVTMMQSVAQAMNESRHLIVEAGTGIGKSVAYLLPSIYFTLQNNTRIIISTNTINLQEQLINKDIPNLVKVLSTTSTSIMKREQPPPPLKTAQLKGRRNYLCLKQWEARRDLPDLSWEETRFLLRLLVWLTTTQSGDRAELRLRGEEEYFWSRISASEDNCLAEHCPYYRNRCFLFNARRSAEKAHILVVNHALLLADLATENRVLPEYNCLIIDEAHHLEAEATEQLGFRIIEQDIQRSLEHLAGRGGVLPRLLSLSRSLWVAVTQQEPIEQNISNVEKDITVMRPALTLFFEMLKDSLSHSSEVRGNYGRHLRLTNKVRRERQWKEVEISWERLSMLFRDVEFGLANLHTSMEDSPHSAEGDMLGELRTELSLQHQQLRKLRERINSVITSPEGNSIYWFSLAGQRETLELHAAPLRIGDKLQELLFSQKDCVILTSATLSTESSFEYTKESLGLRDVEELIVDSPFDYLNSTMLYLIQDIPEPDKPDYQQKVEQALLELCRATQGQTMVLFTSHSALRSTHSTLWQALEQEGIQVLGQGVDGNPRQVLRAFKSNPRSILLGTASLWEGIDIVGETLSVLVIVRLPFTVPTDPIFSARCELFADSFNQYSIPQAVLKFKQGFGRLIRSKQDKGVVIPLDKRLQSKSYGRIFLESLPQCTVRSSTLRHMPQQVQWWLGDKRGR